MNNFRDWEVYRVGGGVRDQLLARLIPSFKLTHYDSDYVVLGKTPQEMLDAGFEQIGQDFPVFILKKGVRPLGLRSPEVGAQYALARTERKQGFGYTGFQCYTGPEVSLEEDLSRRDLTINAMAEDLNGNIIDPWNGQADLQQKILRHVSPAFIEDPVRVLRIARFMARFSSLGFKVAPETLNLMQVMVENGEINALVPERVWQEFNKALLEPTPSAFIETLRACGALAIIFPELEHLFDTSNSKHPEINAGAKSLMALECAVQITQDPVTRFAALVHNLSAIPKKGPYDHARPKTGEAIICNVAKRLRIPVVYKELAVLGALYHTHAHQSLSATSLELLTLFEKLDAFRRPERFQQFLAVCEASACRDIEKLNNYPQRPHLQAAFTAAQQVSIGPLLKQGWKGVALGNQLRQHRIAAIEQLLLEHT